MSLNTRRTVVAEGAVNPCFWGDAFEYDARDAWASCTRFQDGTAKQIHLRGAPMDTRSSRTRAIEVAGDRLVAGVPARAKAAKLNLGGNRTLRREPTLLQRSDALEQRTSRLK